MPRPSEGRSFIQIEEYSSRERWVFAVPGVLRPVMKEQTTGKLRVASTLPTDDVVRAVQVFPAVLGTRPPAGRVSKRRDCELFHQSPGETNSPTNLDLRSGETTR